MMTEKEIEVEELFYKLKIWFQDWFKKLEDKHKKNLERQKIWKRANGWRYRRNKK